MLEDGKIHPATLVRSQRITPPESPEEVRHLVFRSDAPGFDCKMGQCMRAMAPGQYGNKYHPRLYLAGVHDMQTAIEKALAGIAGSEDAWLETKDAMQTAGRWHEVLY